MFSFREKSEKISQNLPYYFSLHPVIVEISMKFKLPFQRHSRIKWQTASMVSASLVRSYVKIDF